MCGTCEWARLPYHDQVPSGGRGRAPCGASSGWVGERGIEEVAVVAAPVAAVPAPAVLVVAAPAAVVAAWVPNSTVVEPVDPDRQGRTSSS